MIQIYDTDAALSVIGHSNPGGHISTREEIEACASITALAQGLIFALNDKGYGNLDCTIGHGLFFLPKAGLGHDGLVIVRAFVSAMEGVQTGYPDQIEVTRSEQENT